MTVSTQVNSVTVQGNGVTTVFDFSFIGVAAQYISVIYTNPSGVQTLLSASSYSISLNAAVANAIWGVGGAVTYPLSGSPIPNNSSLTIQRNLPLEQLITIQNQGDFNPQVVEQMGDLLEMQIQQVNDTFGLAFVASPGDPVPLPVPPVAQRAGKSAMFDGSGNLTYGAGTLTGVTASAAMIPVIQAPTISAARSTLGVGAAAVESLSGTAVCSVIDDGAGNLVLANIPGSRILGNNGSTGPAIALTVAQVNAMLGAGGTGTVTFVQGAVPTDVLTISGGPITTSGTLTLGKASVSANLVMAGPSSGSAAAWGARALVTNDLPGVTGIAGSYGSAGSKTTLIESITIDAKGRVTQVSYVTGASYSGTGGGGGTCFPEDALETMADGTKKRISKVRIGEKVRGRNGEINTVVALERPLLGSRLMWAINRNHFVTDEHLHLRSDGVRFGAISINAIKAEWGVPLPMIVEGGRTVNQVTIGLPDDLVSQLRRGDVLEHEDGPKIVEVLEPANCSDWPPETQLYNLIVDGSGVHTVNGYVVGGGTNKDRWDYETWMPKEQS